MNNKLALLIPVLTVALGVSVYSVAGVKKKRLTPIFPQAFK